jgi:hypothetical protein
VRAGCEVGVDEFGGIHVQAWDLPGGRGRG